jgi:hypothetical protein
MERLLADCETPFTDFRVEDCDGLPKAVFDGLPPEQSSLLSHVLYPDQAYIRELYLDVMKVSGGEALWMSYEDDFVKTSFGPVSALIETKLPTEQTGSHVKMKVPLADVKLLLLKWRFECMRRESIRQTTP